MILKQILTGYWYWVTVFTLIISPWLIIFPIGGPLLFSLGIISTTCYVAVEVADWVQHPPRPQVPPDDLIGVR